jgi:acyl-homoserine lactone acylase PvdQ
MAAPALLLFATLVCTSPHPHPVPPAARWEHRARDVTITRDDWGIAHVHGRTDADAVFGMIYAQAEDDFNRIELNYLNAMGRLAEAEGESAVYQDLRMKLFIEPDSMRALYRRSPAWLQRLMAAWADGLNYYLATHPKVHPRVIRRFEPWMALTFSEGSIGGDIERVDLDALEAFYGREQSEAPASQRSSRHAGDAEPRGSNGIAIAPSNTVNHRTLFLINPHTSFFFRSELHMTSDEGLDAYGAVTWGQFFVYQGFNRTAGWMHTSSGVDAIDEYLETIVQRGGRWYYRYGDGERPVITTRITVPYRTDRGMKQRTFTVFRTHHGPVVRAEHGRWVTVRLMEEPVKALTQSYTRTKARNLAEFERTMELHTNSSNNTVFADAAGNIAYFHANFIPRRDTSFDWNAAVDGSDPRTEWHGVLPVDSSPNAINPSVGWVYNSNDWPWMAAGSDSPKPADYPKYVETGGPSARGRHAVRLLEHRKDFTLDRLLAAAFDSYLTWFERPLPALVRAWDALPARDALKTRLSDQVTLLRTWDRRWSAVSVPTSLAVFWGEELRARAGAEAQRAGLLLEDFVARQARPALLLDALAAASDRLAADFGDWRTPWGEINRFQRLTGDIVQQFNDSAPSNPVPFTSARWGSLASFGARPYPGTRRWYGTSGNSFVAVVEFGDSVRARAVTAGGESGHPGSPHFNDQATRYAAGNLREVYFYPNQLKGHTERVYRPGQ